MDHCVNCCCCIGARCRIAHDDKSPSQVVIRCSARIASRTEENESQIMSDGMALPFYTAQRGLCSDWASWSAVL